MHDDRTSAAVIGAVLAFLADPEQSAFVNGHTLSVNGGWYGDASWESPKRRKQNLYRTSNEWRRLSGRR